MVIYIKVNLKTIRCQDMVNILGMMVDVIKDFGKIIKCKVKGYLFGKMDKYFKEIILMIKNMDLEN
jgi:hypothetical protein